MGKCREGNALITAGFEIGGHLEDTENDIIAVAR